MLDRMSVVQPLGRDTVMMDEARIYPCTSRERFKEEFLACASRPTPGNAPAATST